MASGQSKPGTPSNPPGARSLLQRLADEAPRLPRPGDAPALAPQPATPSARDPDADQERDVWWGSYAGRTMAPSFAVCLLLTAALAAAGWWLTGSFHFHGSVRPAVYSLMAAVWLFQLVRWAYRLAGRNYRLTNKRLYPSDGFLYPLTPPIELVHVVRVQVEQSWLEQRLRVGTVRVFIASNGRSAVALEGVVAPRHVAAEMEKHVQLAREPIVPPTAGASE